ncbi:hypothetical protein BX616_002704 [Lobosporangium transversale]|uniref:glutathione transferase n=1 Tax=Lobosporangium transversale TaxID=64571 RepID=A0A1Y2GLN9_9FUNG|nr:hypothetical protein BCR41DRAFT_386692 [Lobosporangium transversale]KAF9919040.1 hypothetical protein BX616_002704 [Lobosporangium transversale]ORZ14832.1 hypothetical protein BCR41DRAFT_386692 [Lobosporangium transversale]|eukprot:XP_021880964.1 hypothetical protein BCR41DRAFT_386692 [Lobosporangium transversale]
MAHSPSTGLPGSAFTTRTRRELAEAAAATHEVNSANNNVSYKVLYLKLHGMAATTRAILAVSGVKWENIYPSDWVSEKPHTPLGVMPILYEIHRSSPSLPSTNPGLVLEIPESEAIERYLARKFGLLGQDEWEETAINVFYSSSNAIMSFYINKVLLAFPDIKQRELEKFLTKDLPVWISQHEKWLAKNGNNGHYVGDQLSLADIRSVICLERFMAIPECNPQTNSERNMFSLATPGLFKLKQVLDSRPGYAAWISSEEFNTITASTKQRLSVLSG